MAEPVLVRAYSKHKRLSDGPFVGPRTAKALPPLSAYAFSDILRAADSPEFQTAIDGIAEICAKNRMSLADEYASHLPPLGEITASTPSAMKPHLLRPGMRPALTSVPEASSGSSEGSRQSKKRSGIFGFRKGPSKDNTPSRQVRIGSMGRTVSVGSTTALALDLRSQPEYGPTISSTGVAVVPPARMPAPVRRVPSEAQSSLQRLLTARQISQPG